MIVNCNFLHFFLIFAVYWDCPSWLPFLWKLFYFPNLVDTFSWLPGHSMLHFVFHPYWLLFSSSTSLLHCCLVLSFSFYRFCSAFCSVCSTCLSFVSPSCFLTCCAHSSSLISLQPLAVFFHIDAQGFSKCLVPFFLRMLYLSSSCPLLLFFSHYFLVFCFFDYSFLQFLSFLLFFRAFFVSFLATPMAPPRTFPSMLSCLYLLKYFCIV